MLDSYAIISIILRSAAMAPLAFVLWQHVRLFGGKSYPRTKTLLLWIIIFALFNNALTIGVNFYRQDDGNLIADIRHVSQIVNSVAALANSAGWFLLYFDDRE